MTSTELPNWLAGMGLWVGGIAGVVTGVTVICVAARKVTVKLVGFLRRTVHLVDDLIGEPERPGVEGRPGVMERLSGIEDRLGVVEHEVQHNNGGSLKDSARRTEEKVEVLSDQVEAITHRVDAWFRRSE